jgi:hypothetical protein
MTVCFCWRWESGRETGPRRSKPVNEGDERFPREKIPKGSTQRHTFRHNSISLFWFLNRVVRRIVGKDVALGSTTFKARERLAEFFHDRCKLTQFRELLLRAV